MTLEIELHIRTLEKFDNMRRDSSSRLINVSDFCIAYPSHILTCTRKSMGRKCISPSGACINKFCWHPCIVSIHGILGSCPRKKVINITNVEMLERNLRVCSQVKDSQSSGNTRTVGSTPKALIVPYANCRVTGIGILLRL